MAFQEGVLVFNQAGALPGPAVGAGRIQRWKGWTDRPSPRWRAFQQEHGAHCINPGCGRSLLRTDRPRPQDRRRAARPGFEATGHRPRQRRPGRRGADRRSSPSHPMEVDRTGTPGPEQLRVHADRPAPGVADESHVIVARPVGAGAAPIQQFTGQVDHQSVEARNRQAVERSPRAAEHVQPVHSDQYGRFDQVAASGSCQTLNSATAGSRLPLLAEALNTMRISRPITSGCRVSGSDVASVSPTRVTGSGTA